MRRSDLPPTQKELAKVLGIAQSTVSMALRGHSSIPEKTREMVLKAAAAIGYRPNPAGTVLAHHRQSSTVVPIKATLAWINGWSDPARLRSYREFDHYWQGAEMEARFLGYRLEEFVVGPDLTLGKLERILRTRAIRGILLTPGPVPEGWRKFDWSEFAVVRLSHFADPDFPGALSVTGDQAGNALLAFREMLRLGYRRIGFVGMDGRERLFAAGFLLGQQELPEAERCPVLLMSHDGDPRAWERSFREWLSRHRPDAILTDVPGVAAALERLGVRVPDDIGLAALGILDSPIPAGIDQNSHEIGRSAVRALHMLEMDGVRGFPLIHREWLIKGSWVDGRSLPPRRII